MRSADDAFTDEKSADEDGVAINGCHPCYVRCTNAAPHTCHWTGVHKIGNQNDCTNAGKAWCANHGYDHTWAGCSKHLHYPGCP
ncbi:MAG: hypothetical protein H0T76_03895 [Nannocystis sp.]|nr:hypothetical protein [Nannocystis sp.]MBA3545603.1 hypothetical protein [Nannocystis sp.]